MFVNSFTLKRNIAELISNKKGIQVSRLLEQPRFSQLGFDNLDVVDMILEVEKAYKITIPDEVPLNTIDDFAAFVWERSLQQAS